MRRKRYFEKVWGKFEKKEKVVECENEEKVGENMRRKRRLGKV